MKFQRSLLASALIAGAIGPAAAFAPDGCEQQRAQYPTNWNDTSHEKPLFTCSSHYNDPYGVKIGDASAGRTMMRLVPLLRPDLDEKKDGILRIWLDKEQAQSHLHRDSPWPCLSRRQFDRKQKVFNSTMRF